MLINEGNKWMNYYLLLLGFICFSPHVFAITPLKSESAVGNLYLPKPGFDNNYNYKSEIENLNKELNKKDKLDYILYNDDHSNIYLNHSLENNIKLHSTNNKAMVEEMQRVNHFRQASPDLSVKKDTENSLFNNKKVGMGFTYKIPNK